MHKITFTLIQVLSILLILERSSSACVPERRGSATILSIIESNHPINLPIYYYYPEGYEGFDVVVTRDEEVLPHYSSYLANDVLAVQIGEPALPGDSITVTVNLKGTIDAFPGDLDQEDVSFVSQFTVSDPIPMTMETITDAMEFDLETTVLAQGNEFTECNFITKTGIKVKLSDRADTSQWSFALLSISHHDQQGPLVYSNMFEGDHESPRPQFNQYFDSPEWQIWETQPPLPEYLTLTLTVFLHNGMVQSYESEGACSVTIKNTDSVILSSNENSNACFLSTPVEMNMTPQEGTMIDMTEQTSTNSGCQARKTYSLFNNLILLILAFFIGIVRTALRQKNSAKTVCYITLNNQ